MENLTMVLIFGIYILLILCLIFFFRIAFRIQRTGKRIMEFESIYKKEMDNIKEQVDQIKINIDKTKKLFK